jgi:carboxyl-terminal processing protease
MKKNFLSPLLILCGIALSMSAWCKVQPVDPAELVPNKTLEKTARIITKVIASYHYKKESLDDAFSSRILDRYLETLDPNRLFFLASDVAEFAKYRNQLDEHLLSGEVGAAFDIFRVYRQRMDERVARALRLVDAPMDFTRDESYRFDRENEPWARSLDEVNELWRKRVKNDFLSLRIAGKQDEEIRETLRKRYEDLQRRISQFSVQDVFQSFVNAYTLSLEPHTSYMSPSTSENFDISMRLSLEGIGAVLRGDNEYTVVQKTISGGPAELSGQIGGGDKIVGVAQGLDGVMEDVVGWRLQDVVEKIRGPKGSVVRLEIIPKGSGGGDRRKVVALVRNKIKLEEQAAKTEIIEGLEGMGELKIGIIELATFYRDFRGESMGEKNFRSTTRDVRKLLQQLKEQGVDGIVIDLRRNGGGSLSEATELTGLFIDRGPVVQVKDAFGKIEVERDPDPEVVYDGPLAVLVDRNSASASEIFAGAIQDYKRGIVIGEPTFGKGTVQTLVNLNRFVPGGDDDLGRLRLTMAQFFRINGGSTQHRGVVPDILYPTAKNASEHGERSLDNALPWARITPTLFSTKGIGAYARLRERSQQRINADSGFTMLSDQERVLQEMDDLKTLSLNEKVRRAEADKRENQIKEQKNRYLLSQGITPRNEEDDEDETDAEADERERKAIGKIQLNEAARILADYIIAEAQNRPRAAMR